MMVSFIFRCVPLICLILRPLPRRRILNQIFILIRLLCTVWLLLLYFLNVVDLLQIHHKFLLLLFDPLGSRQILWGRLRHSIQSESFDISGISTLFIQFHYTRTYIKFLFLLRDNRHLDFMFHFFEWLLFVDRVAVQFFDVIWLINRHVSYLYIMLHFCLNV